MWYVNNVVGHDYNKLIKSFILTMWYVNQDLFNDFTEGTNCFILTMWYVNYYHKVPSYQLF